MAKHSFSVDFSGAAQDTVAKFKGAIEKAGGKFQGDDGKGDFSVPTPAGTVKGSYTIKAQTVAIDITDKPFILSGGMIEGQVRQFMSSR